jgi:lysophospholipase L1-like esterase
MSRSSMIVVLALTLVLASHPSRADDFALRDGDTVAFLGDSITAARTYGKLIENYTLLRFPERKVRFINVGQGGDTAAGGLARLERDVFQRGATVLTVAYGVNDIGWGLKADAEHKQRYLDAIAEIVKQCRARNVRVFICSAAVTAADPAKSEHDFLQTMCDEGMALAREHGGQSIDVQRTMRAIQQRIWQANERLGDAANRDSLHVADGVHLNPLGQVAMAYAILKGLSAPADVSSVSLDANDQKLLAAEGCAVTDITGSADHIEFARLDEGLPLNGEMFFALHFRFVPIHNELNRYLLQVKSLPEGKYDVIVDGRRVSAYTAAQLAAGVNISSATTNGWLPGGPWDAQANILNSLTEARDKLELSARLSVAHLPDQTLTDQYLERVRSENARLEELQRLVARPRPYRFIVQKAE